jgi:hypothetical protein
MRDLYADLNDILAHESVASEPYVEDCEADMDLVDLVDEAELKGYILG